jgi:hypothetical protein
MANNNTSQKVVDVLGTSGPMSGQDLKAQSGLDTETLKATVYQLITDGIVTKDNNTFDVVPDYRADGRDEQGQGDLAVEFDEPVAAPAKPTPAKPVASKTAAKTAAKATPPAKSAAAKPAPTKPAAKQAAAPAAQENPILYYEYGFDQLTRQELADRAELWMNAAHANAQEGSPENLIVAEGLERLVRRTLRRIKSLDKGTSQVRAR